MSYGGASGEGVGGGGGGGGASERACAAGTSLVLPPLRHSALSLLALIVLLCAGAC